VQLQHRELIGLYFAPTLCFAPCQAVDMLWDNAYTLYPII